VTGLNCCKKNVGWVDVRKPNTLIDVGFRVTQPNLHLLQLKQGRRISLYYCQLVDVSEPGVLKRTNLKLKTSDTGESQGILEIEV